MIEERRYKPIILVIEKGHYYLASPSALGHGIYVVKNMNHHTKTVQVQDVKTGESCWTKSCNINREIPEHEVVLKCLK